MVSALVVYRKTQVIGFHMIETSDVKSFLVLGILTLSLTVGYQVFAT